MFRLCRRAYRDSLPYSFMFLFCIREALLIFQNFSFLYDANDEMDDPSLIHITYRNTLSFIDDSSCSRNNFFFFAKTKKTK